MISAPLVSILIDNYNYGRYVAASIDSALAQTYQNIEIIVVDDGSTDNSREVIETYKDKVEVIFKQNGGQPSAFNLGFMACKGDIVCFLDSDDVYKTNKVERVVQTYAQHPEIQWCFHAYRDVDTSMEKFISRYPRSEVGSQKIDFREALKKGQKPLLAPATSSITFSRKLLAKILPMPDKTLPVLNENYIKYCAILLEQGFFLDEELTDLRIHGSNQASRRQDKPLFKAAREMTIAYFMKTNFPESRKFANRLFGIGAGTYQRNKKSSQEARSYKDEFEMLLSKYRKDLSIPESLEIAFRSLYHHRLRDLNFLK